MGAMVYTKTEMAKPNATEIDNNKLVSNTLFGLMTGIAWTDTAAPQPHQTKRVIAKNSANAGR